MQKRFNNRFNRNFPTINQKVINVTRTAENFGETFSSGFRERGTPEKILEEHEVESDVSNSTSL